MAATTMLFGPEWMRPKHPARAQNPPSPPPTSAPSLSTGSSYSSLVAPAPTTPQERTDSSNPFLYSKEDMLRIYKEGGGRGGLGLEVERWEGVVREVGNEPVALKEWSDGERKVRDLFSHDAWT
jgi:PERQ amino acid-rich with GYF domain-containing protein